MTDKTPEQASVELCKALRLEGRLIPFIGAGLSSRFGLPSSSQLVTIIAKALGWDSDVLKLSGDFSQLADYFVATRGSIGPLRSLLDKEFNRSEDQVRKSLAHKVLAELSLPIIYTTNFDTIIEQAFALYGKPYVTVSSIRDIETARASGTQIVKFHGTFENDESLVLTESSYFDRLEFESPLDIRLRADMLGRCLLFIGYSFSDTNLRYMLYKLHKMRKAHSATQRFPAAIMTTFTDDEVQRLLLQRWDVLTLTLDPISRDRSLDDFLEKLL